MGWLTVNGIELKRIVASLGGDTSGNRRDIGSESDASDGSLIVTRQTRKRDFKFTSVPLTGVEAFAWEGLLVGEGDVWNFDTSPYSSKGRKMDVPSPSVLQSTQKKFGAQALFIPGGFSSVCTTVGLGEMFYAGGPKTISGWRYISSVWRHVVARSDGAGWLDGVADSLSGVPDLPIFNGDVMTVTATSADVYWDDLVACPYLWKADWARQVFAAGRPFGLTPFLTAAGSLVPEALTRKMVCPPGGISEKVMIAGLDGALQRDARVLSVELKAA